MGRSQDLLHQEQDRGLGIRGEDAEKGYWWEVKQIKNLILKNKLMKN